MSTPEPAVTTTSTTTATEPPAATVVPPGAATAPAADAAALAKLQAEVEKWKALSRKNEEQAKGNAGAVTERDQLAERLSVLEQEATSAKAEALRLKVSADKGVPANLLSGSTEQELAASADALLEFRGSQQPRSATPQEAAAGNQGGKSAARGPSEDFADFLTQQLRRS